MGIDDVRAYLEERGFGERLMEFEESSATVAEAAHAVGVDPARIAKTLSFKVHDEVILVVCAGDARVNNQAFKATFHGKPKMLKADECEELVGFAPGGVCPFGVPAEVGAYLDESLRRFDVVYPAAGNAASAVRLTCDELASLVEPGTWVDVCKGWRPEEG